MRHLLVSLVILVSFHVAARESTPLGDGWRFLQGDPVDAAGKTMSPSNGDWNDSNWQTVTVPHCWGWQEAQKGDKNYYRGPGWYQREFEVTPKPGKRYFLRFDAASSVADVYLNGIFIGQHRGAFGAFC